jgi:hypothetical protein
LYRILFAHRRNKKAAPETASRPVSLFGLGKTRGELVFASGKEAKQVAVGNGAEGFRAVAVVAEAAGGKDQRPSLAVFGLKAVERGEGDAVSAIEVVEGFKEFGFALMVVLLMVVLLTVRAAAALAPGL